MFVFRCLGETFLDISCKASFVRRQSYDVPEGSLKLPLGETEQDAGFKEVKDLIKKGTNLAKNVLEEHKEILDKVKI